MNISSTTIGFTLVNLALLFIIGSSFTLKPLSSTRKVHQTAIYLSPEEDMELTRSMLMNIGSSNPSNPSNPSSSSSSLLVQTLTSPSPSLPPPTWLFRQAGRHLPEYAAYKAEHGVNFLDMISSPAHIAACTLQPLQRYRNLDAAILFSDILVIPEALGIEVTMPGGVGIQVPDPLQSVEEVVAMTASIDASGVDAVVDKLEYVMDGVRLIKSTMASSGLGQPLIGFSAAPYTLFYYMVGGTSKKNVDVGEHYMRTYPVESAALMSRLSSVVVEYLRRQRSAGCDLVQVFEAMGGTLEEGTFDGHVLPVLEGVGRKLEEKGVGPAMCFARGACHANPRLGSAYDCVTVDTVTSAVDAQAAVGCAVQGGFDPAMLIGEDTEESRGRIKEAVAKVLKDPEFKRGRYVANLGEGLGGKESTDLVQYFLDVVKGEA
mmetsp:Transcript_10786/g.21889  ORF Transcript_10786/g.21889 Transcript_10786/m.21889 type:complete len:432 (+) Transcript_10786:116-1411(+)